LELKEQTLKLIRYFFYYKRVGASKYSHFNL